MDRETKRGRERETERERERGWLSGDIEPLSAGRSGIDPAVRSSGFLCLDWTSTQGLKMNGEKPIDAL